MRSAQNDEERNSEVQPPKIITMKILQINKFFFLKGGAERYFFDLAELLSDREHQVVVWSTRHPQNFSFTGQDDFAEFSDLSKNEGFLKDLKKVRRIFWNKEAAKKLERVIEREKPDVAHLHNIFGHFSPSIIFTLKKHRIPIVITLHDYKFFCPNSKFFSRGKVCYECLKKRNERSCFYKKCIQNSRIKSFLGYLEGKWQRNFLKVAHKIDMFLAPSLFIKEKALEWGIPFDKIIHLPNFIAIDNLEKIRQNKDEKYILYFGRLSEEKGIALLIKAFIGVVGGKATGWKLKIAGDGPEEENLKKIAEGKKSVEFLGRLNGGALKEKIFNARLVVVPSLWSENFPYSVLESFALGKPVLASKIGGLIEMIKSGKTGLLFEAGDENDLAEKILWAINQPDKIKKMGEKAREEVLKKYDPERHYEKLIGVYERVI